MKCNGITVVSDGMKSLKGVYKESKELIKEYNIFKTIKSDLKEFVTGVDESVYRGNVNTDGITDDKARQIIDTSKSGRILVMGSLTSFFKAAHQRFPEAGEFHYSYDTGPNETQWVLDNLPGISAGYDTVIICVSNENHKKIAEYFKGSSKKVIILCTMDPGLAENMHWADSILLGYSWRCDYSMKAMLSAVNGEFTPTGTKPFN